MVPELLATAQTYFYTVVRGLIILLAGFGLGVLVKKLLVKVLREINLNKIMSKVGITADIERWASSIVSYLIYLFTILIFLDTLGIKSVVIYLIAGGVLALVILTFLVGLKDVIPNFIGWLMIQRRGKLKVGKSVEVKEIRGTVEKIGYLETEIRTASGDVLYVPNSLFMKSKFKLR